MKKSKPIGQKYRTFMNSFEKSCLSLKLFVMHLSVGNRIKIKMRNKACGLTNCE